MEVGEQRVVQAVHHLGIAHLVHMVAYHRAPPGATELGCHGAHALTFFKGHGTGVAHPNIEH